jgi:GxxExxY protein
MNTDLNGLKHGAITDKVIRAYYEVYNTLGFGFLESVYESAQEITIRDLGLSVARQAPITVSFRGQCIGDFRADLLVESAVIVELKAASTMVAGHEAQILNYLRASSIEVGLLLNFGPKPEFKRFTFDNQRKQIRVYRCASAADLRWIDEVP